MSRSVPKVGFVSLGCPKATVDAERILTQLRAEGYAMVPDFADADLVVVNTCGFIDAAVEESLDTIGEALAENGRVVVTGCLGAKDEVIRASHPQVLAVTGPNQLEAVMEAVHAHLPPEHDPFVDLVPPGGVKLTPRHYAYLKIAEGCNQLCSFCIIPSMRGRLVSRPAGEVLAEAERLVSAGVQELLVVSQDTGAYGVDLKYRTSFWNGRPVRTRTTELARELGQLGVWVRLHYLYPYPHLDEILPLMAEGLVLPYLDVPLQHASPAILKAMRRPGDVEGTLRRIEQWRRECPDLTLRSTFIVGFPGETDADFERLLEFLEEARLDRVGAFAYSPVEGAAANALPGAVPEELKEERLERFMELQAAISADKLQDRVGHIETVLVDELFEDGVVARSRGDAPEVDGNVFIETDAELAPGQFVEVRITAAGEHDLYAELI
ncbi:MAG: 30S ribosomal protein S12 methylthiotransferase RimO [Hydrogenophaga sp.]|nr:30S ribosomal protein S12 methylthiotransferase RimO [Gammaproteobacteria bacterium]